MLIQIPDENLQKILEEKFPDAFTLEGDLDTEHQSISIPVEEQWLDIENVENFEGLQYIKSLDALFVKTCDISEMNIFPPNLTTLAINRCFVEKVTNLPLNLKNFDCCRSQTSYIDKLPDGLESFRCTVNNFTTLPKLPKSLVTMNCCQNPLESIPELPVNLKHFYCDSKFNNETMCYNDYSNRLAVYSNGIIHVGCFTGNIDKFERAVKEKYKDYKDKEKRISYFNFIERLKGKPLPKPSWRDKIIAAWDDFLSLFYR